MARNKKRGGSAPSNTGMKDAQTLVRDARKRAQELLKKAGLNVKDVRRDVRTLQKAGLASARLDVKHYQPSRYMISKLKRNVDIITGKAVAIVAPKDIRQKYAATGTFEERYGKLIVPRDYEHQRTRISRGLVEVTGRLKWGDERRIILPFKAADMQDVAFKLQTDPTLEGLKNPDELFGFRLFGHSMATFGFPDAAMLADYILTHYAHLFKGNNGREGIRHFELIRFKSRGSRLEDGPESEKIYAPRKKPKPVKDWLYNRQLRKDALRKRRERDKETAQEKAERVEKQRIRQAILRQRKFDDQ
jgi:hypothetical protein